MNEKRYMDVDELSGYLGISRWLIYKFVKNREMPFIPFGRLVRFDRHAIDHWADKRMVRGFRRKAVGSSWTDYDADIPANVIAEWERAAEEFTETPVLPGFLVELPDGTCTRIVRE